MIDMPNRILREGVLTSERVNSLGWAAEVFYRRLMSVVDDYGRYYAKPTLLRAACYPLQLDKVSDADIAKWLEETQKAGLVSVWRVEGRGEFLELCDFRQQTRAKESKFPPSPSDAIGPPSGLLADATHPLTKTDTDSETNTRKRAASQGSRLPPDWVLPDAWLEWSVRTMGWTQERTRSVAEQFRDHWHSKAGRDALKVDWLAAWRTWCRREVEFSRSKAGNGSTTNQAPPVCACAKCKQPITGPWVMTGQGRVHDRCWQ